MFEELTPLKRSVNPFVLNVRNFAPYPETLQSDSGASHVINGPTTFMPDSMTSIFVATANLMTLTISRMQSYLMWKL
jgi:hypothetical protein